MMQITHPLTRYYYELKIDEIVYSKIVFECKKKLDQFDTLISEGCFEETVLKVIDFSRAPYYRLKQRFKKSNLSGLEPKSKKPKNVRKPLWNKATQDLICKIRNTQAFCVWGKEKITALKRLII